MYTIGEFSRITNLTVKTLRFYHERGLLTPASIDSKSGYRYYDNTNLETANIITTLRNFEFSLDEIELILNECNHDSEILEHLEHQKEKLAHKLQNVKIKLNQIDQVINYQKNTKENTMSNTHQHEPTIKTIEPILAAGFRMKGKYSDCGKGFAKVGRKAGRHINGKPFCIYYDCEYKENDADYETCFPVKKEINTEDVKSHTLPKVTCVTLLHHGPYDTLKSSYARIMEYIKENNYEIKSPSREVYIKGPGMIFKGNPKKYITEIQMPIDVRE